MFLHSHCIYKDTSVPCCLPVFSSRIHTRPQVSVELKNKLAPVSPGRQENRATGKQCDRVPGRKAWMWSLYTVNKQETCKCHLCLVYSTVQGWRSHLMWHMVCKLQTKLTFSTLVMLALSSRLAGKSSQFKEIPQRSTSAPVLMVVADSGTYQHLTV